MTKLQCNVNSCSSYNKGYCCRPCIHVNGATAHMCSETNCQSYSENTNQMTSGCQYNNPNQILDISCDANQCLYNHNHKCTADSISINSGCSGTECSSFKTI